MKRIKDDEVKTQVVSDFGMTMELYIETGNASIDKRVDYPLFKVYADEETEEKYVEISSGGQLIQLPIEAVKKFLLTAETEVHSEAWYDKNVFNQE
ncbi:hypothetical protein ACJJIP_07865 [Microbulbifer sp. VTAC004]|uniref:hypothetical protein n=1 Tax=Microbulbifer TaxID=48073 RepID=UPI00039F2375|nr:hypothetical protein [Microbulbifer variabilis]